VINWVNKRWGLYDTLVDNCTVEIESAETTAGATVKGKIVGIQSSETIETTIDTYNDGDSNLKPTSDSVPVPLTNKSSNVQSN
jgi:hypothetical protein